MTRPYMQWGVGQLEALFEKAAGDDKVLRQLAHELQFRQVPRAIALLDRVAAAQRQPKLQRQSEAAGGVAIHASRPAVQVPLLPDAGMPSPHSLPIAPVSAAPIATSPEVALTLAMAQSLLNAPAGTPWEAIEQRRRDLVEKSNPLASAREQHSAQALNNAARANAAYRVLLQARCVAPN
jgi:hypothetical protein